MKSVNILSMWRGGLALVWVISGAANADQLSVQVFTDLNRYPAPATDTPYVLVRIYDLAAPQRLAKAVSVGLPANPEAAFKLAQERFAANQGRLKQELVKAYDSHLQAQRLGLTHYPALVFNEHAVIYGVTDVPEGIRRYQQWLDTSPR